MMDRLLRLLADEEAMSPSDDRLSRLIRSVTGGETRDTDQLDEEELEMVQAAVRMPEKPAEKK